jgi:hypothetical protein
MNHESGMDGQCAAEAVMQVRDFVAEQVRAGQRPDALSFALTYVATELGMQATHGRNPIGVLKTILSAVLKAVPQDTVGQLRSAGAERPDMPSDGPANLGTPTVRVH